MDKQWEEIELPGMWEEADFLGGEGEPPLVLHETPIRCSLSDLHTIVECLNYKLYHMKLARCDGSVLVSLESLVERIVTSEGYSVRDRTTPIVRRSDASG